MRSEQVCVGIIGTGNLGLRHAESVYLDDMGTDLHLIDPDKNAMDRFATNLGEQFNADQFNFHCHISGLPEHVDVAIIATTADIRLMVLRQLLDTTRVRYIVLEKVAFQSHQQLAEAGVLANENQLQMWVNCTRRSIRVYQDIRQQLSGCGPFKIQVEGGDWGLACNAIHYIDYFAWLTRAEVLSVDISGLDKAIHRTKRSGFIELTGRLEIKFADGTELSLISEQDTACTEMATSILAEDAKWKIIEANWRCELQNHKGQVLLQGRMSFQSQLSGSLVSDLAERGNCTLTPYGESTKHHEQIISAFNKHIEVVDGRKLTVCPIT